jgi:hypothetical protein
MTTIRVDQLVFTRVEHNYSHQNKSGWQFAYNGTSLSVPALQTIEDRISCFQPADPSIVRHQFFVLNNDAAVLTHSVHIDPHPEITDRATRPGAFIGHCLVLSKSEFAKVQYNPFVLFEELSFITDPVSMVDTFGKAAGRIPTQSLFIRNGMYTTGTDWVNRDIEQLIAAAEVSSQFIKNNQVLLLIGKTERAYETLKLIFHLTREKTRLSCSFSTYIDNCVVKPGSYWAMGTAYRQGNPAVVVNVDQNRIQTSSILALDTEDLYLDWLHQKIKDIDISQVIQQAPMIQTIAQNFSGQGNTQIDIIDESAFHSFQEVHQKRIQQAVQAVFAQEVSDDMADSLAHLAHQIWPDAVTTQTAAQATISPSMLADLIYQWLKQSQNQPKIQSFKDAQWVKFQKIAERGAHPHLLYLSAVCRKRVDSGMRDRILQQLDDDAYVDLLSFLMNPVPPAHFVNARHLDTFLRQEKLGTLANADLVAVIEAFVEQNCISHLDGLNKYIAVLDNKHLAQVEKLLEKTSQASNRFKKAVERRRSELGSRGLLDRILRR